MRECRKYPTEGQTRARIRKNRVSKPPHRHRHVQPSPLTPERNTAKLCPAAPEAHTDHRRLLVTASRQASSSTEAERCILQSSGAAAVAFCGVTTNIFFWPTFSKWLLNSYLSLFCRLWPARYRLCRICLPCVSRSRHTKVEFRRCWTLRCGWWSWTLTARNHRPAARFC